MASWYKPAKTYDKGTIRRNISLQIKVVTEIYLCYNIDMKLIIAFLFIVIMTTGLLSNPVFVVASDTCYVDEDADDDGNGNDNEPYQEIDEALDEGCKEIIVKKGKYKDDIVIGKGVEVDGKNKDDIIITGKITMEDNSEISDVTISDSGINVKSGAHVKIEDANIKKTRIGINTEGGGKLTVKNVVLYDNGKAMYLQRGTNINITNSKVYDNDEEGIDIRANVDGVISGNSIYNNGESGIEVIAGKSELKITNNTIKKNKASGIAVQYYTSTSKLGGLKIKDNKITNNKDFGINCKAPSGGNTGVDYWTKTVEMLENKVFDNKDGNFSDTCHFNASKISDATKSKKQKEQEQKLEKLQKEEVQKAIIEREEKLQKTKIQEKQKKNEQELLRNKLQEEMNLQSNVNKLKQDVDEFYNIDNLSQEKIKNRPSILMFLIGPDYKELRSMAERIGRYDTKIQEAQKIKDTAIDEVTKKRMQEDIATMIQKKSTVYNFIKQYNDEFSYFGCFFKKKI